MDLQDEKTATTTASPAGVVVKDIDDAELETAGYQRSMPRQFSTLSLMALSFDLTATWMGIGSSLGIALSEASAAGTIWSLVIAGAFTAILSAGLAELASAYPIAGAQYYWAFMVSSPEWAPFAAFFNGWMSIFAWWFDCSAVANLLAGMILALATLWYPDYEIKAYHQYLMYVLLIWLSIGVNVFGSQIIPLWNKTMMSLYVITLIATFITILVCARDHFQSAAWVFGDTTNSTGWPSTGFAFMLAVMNGVFSYLGTDCAAHLAEEIPNPGRNVPRAIMWPILLGLICSWPYAIACVASISHIDGVLNGETGFPLLTIYYQATGSKAGATVLLAMFVFCFFGCMVACMTTSSRTLWAVSRDNALPYSKFWMRVSPTWQMPVNATCLSGLVMSLYGLIFIGSANVFSSMISACVIFCQTSVVIPQVIVLWRGREKVLPRRYFAIPEPWGKVVNIVAVAWVVFVDVLECFPVFYPVTLESMNWISVISVAVLVFIALLWIISKRRVFKGPIVDMEKMRLRREEALGIGSATGVEVMEGSNLILRREKA